MSYRRLNFILDYSGSSYFQTLWIIDAALYFQIIVSLRINNVI